MRKPGAKVAKVLSVLLAATAVVTPLTACGEKNDPNTLNIVCLDKGYGTEWIQTLIDEYKQSSGKNVKLTTNADISSRLAKGSKNVDDLYISVGAEWKFNAAAGKFAELDDLIEETVNGTKIKDRVLPEYSQSIYYPDLSGNLHTYRLPWTAGVGGIFYNAKMFEDNNWSIPETYDDLVTLVGRIKRDQVAVPGADANVKVKPFIYTGQNTDYFDYAVYTWWAQLAGEDNIKEFMKYESASNFDVSANATYADLKTATGMWWDLFSDGNNYLSGNDNHSAQTQFANGYAAMMFNGEWLYNEILGYETDFSAHFSLGYMQTPTASGAVDPDIMYTIGEDQYIAIPESSIKKDMAKDFIKLMVSDHGCEVFANKAHGVLAYTGSLTATTTDPFMSELLSVKRGASASFTSYPPVKDIQNLTSANAMLNLNNIIDIWTESGQRPFEWMLKNTRTLDSAFTSIKNNAADNWTRWRRSAELE